MSLLRPAAGGESCFAGFFFIVRFGIGEYNKYMLDFKRDDCKTLLWYREEIMMVFGVMIAKGTY